VWTVPSVVEARERLYENLRAYMGNPHGWVVERIATSIENYVKAFDLFGSVELLETGGDVTKVQRHSVDD